MLHRVLLTTASVAALTATANAGDLYRPAPASVPYAGVNWSGFYVGVNGGYGASSGASSLEVSGVNTEFTLSGADKKSFDRTGGFGGGQIGYNLQTGGVVLGVEADLQGSGITGSSSAGFKRQQGLAILSPSEKGSSELYWFSSVRGRLGYTFDRALVYATGGVAFGSVKDQLSLSYLDNTVRDNSGSGMSKTDGTLTGYTVGGGVEYLITPAWSLKAEYQYLDLGSTTESIAVPENANKTTISAREKVDHTYNTARIGLNYHIGGGNDPLK